MGRDDPFTGYSLVLKPIVYGIVPLFTAFQFVRLRRALHVFQLEAYKRRNFRRWLPANRDKALFLKPSTAKKPLVMTGRAWRILLTATALSLFGVLLPSAFAHLVLGGAPADLVTWAAATLALFFWAPLLVPAADWLLTPVQDLVNRGYLNRARRVLATVAPTVVGITGSYGKTSTKFAVGTLLGDDALVTPGSFNTTMGVCRTINEHLEERHRYFVVEMGARQAGDIAEIGRLVRHRIAVLTAIGTAHLESFGSRDAIKSAKLEIVETLADGGVAVVNSDDATIRGLGAELEGVEVVRYGLDPAGEPDVTATGVEVTREGTRMTVLDRRSNESLDVTTKLLGRHSIGHVLAAVAVARSAGVPLDSLRARVAALAPVEHRLQLIEAPGGVTVLDDAFNSNPEGAAAALEVLSSMPARQKIVVTPGMVELGELQAAANEEFGRRAAAISDVLIVVARVNRDAIVAGASGGRARVVTVASLDEATAELASIVASGDVVLFENDLPDQYEG